MSGEFEVESSLTYDGGRAVGIINQSEVGTGAIAASDQVRSLMTQLSSWVQTARAASNKGGLLDRSTYTQPTGPYEQMRIAREAVASDDVVGLVADATEALAFEGGLKWEAADPDDADVFNQLSAQWNLDAVVRNIWRETFTYDQAVVAKTWSMQRFTVRGRTAKGNLRKKTYDIYAPDRLVSIDAAKVVPVGVGPLRPDLLAWIGAAGVRTSADGRDLLATDPLMAQFFSRVYEPSLDEQAQLSAWGVPMGTELLLCNPDWVFRHTSTRPDYRHFADVRMRSVFPLLDLKRQQMASDRATLIAAANYILLIRKGSPEQPATSEEIANLRENYNFLAKVPVIVADHRLSIDIVAPKQDFVLKPEAYETLDRRILARTLATFTSAPGSVAGASAFEEVLAKVIQSRRHMIKRTLERELALAVVNHPRNAGRFASTPNLVFTRRNVRVGIDQMYMSTLWSMRQANETSRDTMLEFMGLDQNTEAQRRELEDELYDEIFLTTSNITGQPVAPNEDTGPTEAPANSGRRGGRPPGGRSPGAPAKPGRNGGITDNGNPSTSRPS